MAIGRKPTVSRKASAGKRAAVFTIISLVFISIMFMSLKTDHKSRMRERSFVINDRVHSVDYFIDDVERDIRRGVYIAGFRALVGVQQYITSTGNYINDTDLVFREMLLNGTINRTYMSVMNNTELNVWIDRIKDEASKISVVLDYEITDIKVYQTSPWKISIDLYVRLNISDSLHTAYWVRDQVISTPLEIEYFEDPLYTVSTYGRVINTIRKTNITDFTDGQDTANLIYHVDNSLYIATNTSPSYLMRLAGNHSGSEFGIESIVNLKRLEDASLNITAKSCVDHVYFSDDDPESWVINETYNWLRLHDAALPVYEAEHLADK